MATRGLAATIDRAVAVGDARYTAIESANREMVHQLIATMRLNELCEYAVEYIYHGPHLMVGMTF